MVDRRQGNSHVSPLQFWLGIAVSIAVLAGLTLKVGQWTERVDGSVGELSRTVTKFEAVATRLANEHHEIQMNVQESQIKIQQLENRRESPGPPIPGFDNLPLSLDLNNGDTGLEGVTRFRFEMDTSDECQFSGRYDLHDYVQYGWWLMTLRQLGVAADTFSDAYLDAQGLLARPQ